MLTDSGGIQEETTALGVPCVTLRENTERPVTISEGTNVLAGVSRARHRRGPRARRCDKTSRGTRVPELWDGRAGERIVAVLRTTRWAAPGRALPPSRRGGRLSPGRGDR